MPWASPTTADLLSEFTAQEESVLGDIQGATGQATAILARAVAEVRDAIRAGGYALDSDVTKLPLGLHGDCLALARWRWLTSAPALKVMQTDGRKDAMTAALEKLAKIAAQTWSVEPPTAGTVSASGTWNSEQKLVPRTHPVPAPLQQFPSGTDDYANADAPADE